MSPGILTLVEWWTGVSDAGPTFIRRKAAFSMSSRWSVKTFLGEIEGPRFELHDAGRAQQLLYIKALLMSSARISYCIRGILNASSVQIFIH